MWSEEEWEFTAEDYETFVSAMDGKRYIRVRQEALEREVDKFGVKRAAMATARQEWENANLPPDWVEPEGCDCW